jgi:hypothetical protein
MMVSVGEIIVPVGRSFWSRVVTRKRRGPRRRRRREHKTRRREGSCARVNEQELAIEVGCDRRAAVVEIVEIVVVAVAVGRSAVAWLGSKDKER